MRFTFYIFIVNLFITNHLLAQKAPPRSRPGPATATVSGYVRETGSQEALIGVNVYRPGTITGTTTNTYGFYSLTLPLQDSLRLAYSFVGYETLAHTVDLRTNVVLNVPLTSGRLLNQVEVRAGRTEEKVSESIQMSRIDIPVRWPELGQRHRYAALESPLQPETVLEPVADLQRLQVPDFVGREKRPGGR